MVDTLALSANERVDLTDLQYAAFGSQLGFHRLENAQLMTNGSSLWVLNGFTQSATGTSLTVNIGSAMLAYRVGVQVQYGVVAAEGDAVKTLDLSSYPSGTYNAYIRFNYAAGAFASRIFWNSANSGTEYPKTVPTRQIAQWELRVEATSPGAEWLLIAQVVSNGTTLTVTDKRPMYFEGSVDQGYANTWGAGNDRSANRALYGVRDFQTFTQAMRQCIEDIKGPGLRRWWASDIGGQNIGFVGTVIEDRTAWCDANFYAQGDINMPVLGFSASVQMRYNRTTTLFQWMNNATPFAQLTTLGKLALGNTAPINGIDATGAMSLGTYASAYSLGAGNFVASGTLFVGPNFVTGKSSPVGYTNDVATFTGSYNGDMGLTLANASTGASASTAMRLVSLNTTRQWTIQHTATNGLLTIADSLAAATRLAINSSGQVNMPISLYVGKTNTFAAGPSGGGVLNIDAGTLGSSVSTVAETVRHLLIDNNSDVLRQYGYRATTVGAPDWTTVDWYLQRSVDGINKGFLAYYGSSTGTTALNEGVGIGFGDPGTVPNLLVAAGKVLINTRSPVTNAYTSGFPANTAPLQLVAETNSTTTIAINGSSGAAGMVMAYVNSTSYPTYTSGGTAGVLGTLGAGNLLFVQGGSFVGGVFGGNWVLGGNSNQTVSASLHIRGNPPRIMIDGSSYGQNGAELRMVSYSMPTYPMAISFYDSGTLTYTLGTFSNNFYFADNLNGTKPWNYNGTTKVMDFSAAVGGINVASASKYTYASTQVTMSISPADAVPILGTITYREPTYLVAGGTIDQLTATIAGPGATGGQLTAVMVLPIKLPRACTLVSLTVSYYKAMSGSSTTTLTLTRSNLSGTTNLATKTSAAQATGTFTYTLTPSTTTLAENDLNIYYLVVSDNATSPVSIQVSTANCTYNVSYAVSGTCG